MDDTKNNAPGDDESLPTEDKPEERETLTAKISAYSAEGWRSFCSRHGISITAMLEVAGRELADETIPPTVEARRRMVEKARLVDQSRRSRKKHRPQ